MESVGEIRSILEEHGCETVKEMVKLYKAMKEGCSVRIADLEKCVAILKGEK